MMSASQPTRSLSKRSTDQMEYDPGRLMLAVRTNNTMMARQLLEKLPDPALLNVTDDWGYTPLHSAAEENKTDICRLLLAANGNIRIKDTFGNTALHLAASGGSTDVAELLVSRRAPLDVRNDAGNTALHLAASRGHIGIVEMLVVAGGDASLTNSEQKTALKLAESKRQTAVVHYLRGVEKEQISSVYEEIKAREDELVEAHRKAVREARHRLFRARVFTISPPESTDDLSIRNCLVMHNNANSQPSSPHRTIHIDPVTYNIRANQSTPWDNLAESPMPQHEVYDKAVAQYIMREMLKRSPILKANVSQQDLRRKAAAERRERYAKESIIETDSVIEEGTEYVSDVGPLESVEEPSLPDFDIINSQRRESISQAPPLVIENIPENVQKHIIEMWREVKKTGNTDIVNELGDGNQPPHLSLSVWEVRMNANSALREVVWPIFFTHKAFYAAGYDLSKPWNCESEHVNSTADYRDGHRNLDAYLRNLCSIVAQVPPHHYSWFGINRKTQHVAPPFTIVGMHRDVSSSEDVVARANLEQVQMKVMDSPVSLHAPDHGKYVFSIPGNQAERILRCYIDQTLRNESFCGEAVSVCVLLFQQCIDSLKAAKRKALPYDRLVKQIGKKAIQASHVTIDRILIHCHDSGHLFHFSDSPILRSVVFLCPQWLIDLLDAVLSLTAVQSVNEECQQGELLENPAITKLRETGEIDESLLKAVSDQFGVEDALGEMSLSDVLEGFDLLVKIANGDGFHCYIPLLADKHCELSFPSYHKIIEGCVKCYDTHCPFALFYYLAGAYLLGHFYKHNKFQLFKKRVNMKVRDNVELILIEHLDHITVLLVCMEEDKTTDNEHEHTRNTAKTDKDLQHVCDEVNQAIEEGLALVKSRWIPGLLAQLEVPLSFNV